MNADLVARWNTSDSAVKDLMVIKANVIKLTEIEMSG